MLLSQCMIVKNEEANIKKALSWAKSIAGEQIVVDTGSTDRTVELAEEMGAKVFHFKWNNDFSAAKNYAISLAKGDWIAFLDADEYMEEADTKKLFAILNERQQKKLDVQGKKCALDIINCSWIQLNSSLEPFMVLFQYRIFRNAPHIRYEQKIHETLASMDGRKLLVANYTKELSIYHTGYAWTEKSRAEKSSRNIMLIENELAENPDHAHMQLYLAESLQVAGQRKEAIRYLKKAVTNKDYSLNPDRLTAAYQSLLYALYEEYKASRLPEIKKDMDGYYQQAVEINPDYPDFDIAAGFFQYITENWLEAAFYLEQGLRKLEASPSLFGSRTLSLMDDIYESLQIAYAQQQQWPKVLSWITINLKYKKFKPILLKRLFTMLSLGQLGPKTADEVLQYLNMFFHYSDERDVLYLIKQVKLYYTKELEELLSEYLPAKQREILYPAKKELPFPAACSKLDFSFYTFMETILNFSEAGLISYMKEKLLHIQKNQAGYYESIQNNYNHWEYWGSIDLTSNDLTLLKNRTYALKHHFTDFMWIYEQLYDFQSKKVLFNLLRHWVSYEKELLAEIQEKDTHQYFDPDIFLCDSREVIADLGAYTGDTYEAYCNTYGARNYKHYYCYEPSPKTIGLLNKKLAFKRGVFIRPKGAGASSGISSLKEDTASGSANRLAAAGQLKVPVITIDQDITESVTFIKMDIEGAEQAALAGCRRHIEHEHPKLALAAYHNNEDIWKLAKIIQEYDRSYQFYLRYYGGSIYPSEYVLYAK